VDSSFPTADPSPRPGRIGPGPARLAELAGLVEELRLDGQVRAERRRAEAERDYQNKRDQVGARRFVGGEGDRFFDVLIETFPDQLRAALGDVLGLTAENVRAYLARQLLADRDEIGPLTALVGPRQISADDAHPDSQLDIDSVIDTVATMDEWDDAAGDVVLELAAMVFGLSMTVLGPTNPFHVGVPDQPPTAYVWYEGLHYDAVRRDNQDPVRWSR
jgi:hypothetical protein